MHIFTILFLFFLWPIFANLRGQQHQQRTFWKEKKSKFEKLKIYIWKKIGKYR